MFTAVFFYERSYLLVFCFHATSICHPAYIVNKILTMTEEIVAFARSLLTPDCLVIEVGGELFAAVQDGVPIAFFGKYWSLANPLNAEMIRRIVAKHYANTQK